MPRTYTKILIHRVYSTKNRVKSIREPERVWSLTREIARNLKIDIRAIGGTSDHLHFLFVLPADRRLSDVVRDLKSNSSLILRKERPSFHWQDGYAAINVSPRSIPSVIRYIEHQEEHHRKGSFEEEYIDMLIRAGSNTSLNMCSIETPLRGPAWGLAPFTPRSRVGLKPPRRSVPHIVVI